MKLCCCDKMTPNHTLNIKWNDFCIRWTLAIVRRRVFFFLFKCMPMLKTRNNDAFPFSNNAKLKFQKCKWNPIPNAIKDTKLHLEQLNEFALFSFYRAIYKFIKMIKKNNVFSFSLFQCKIQRCNYEMKRSKTHSDSKDNKNHTWDKQVGDTLSQLK